MVANLSPAPAVRFGLLPALPFAIDAGRGLGGSIGGRTEQPGRTGGRPLVLRGSSVRPPFVARIVIGGSRSAPQIGDGGLQLAPWFALRGRGRFATVERREGLMRLVELQPHVTAFPVAALEKSQNHFIVGRIVRRQDEGIVGPELQFALFAERCEVQPVARVARPARLVLRATNGRQHDDSHARIGERPQMTHRRIDRAALVAMLARRLNPLDVVQHDQPRAFREKLIRHSGDVGQVERRSHERQPFRQFVERVQSRVDSLGCRVWT